MTYRSGFRGRMGGLIDQIGLLCRPIVWTARPCDLQQNVTATSSNGGSSGSGSGSSSSSSNGSCPVFLLFPNGTANNDEYLSSASNVLATGSLQDLFARGLVTSLSWTSSDPRIAGALNVSGGTRREVANITTFVEFGNLSFKTSGWHLIQL